MYIVHILIYIYLYILIYIYILCKCQGSIQFWWNQLFDMISLQIHGFIAFWDSLDACSLIIDGPSQHYRFDRPLIIAKGSKLSVSHHVNVVLRREEERLFKTMLFHRFQWMAHGITYCSSCRSFVPSISLLFSLLWIVLPMHIFSVAVAVYNQLLSGGLLARWNNVYS